MCLVRNLRIMWSGKDKGKDIKMLEYLINLLGNFLYISRG